MFIIKQRIICYYIIFEMSSKDNRPLVIEDPIVIPLKQKCRGVAAGPSHSYAICDDEVYFWGLKHATSNETLQERESFNSEKMIRIAIKVDRIATGAAHTFGWSGTQVFCWGSNESYELGLQQQRSYGCEKVHLFEAAMKQGYTLQQITCGDHHTLAIFSNHNIEDAQDEHLFGKNEPCVYEKEEQQSNKIQLFAWGESESFQLTLNTEKIVPQPILSPIAFKKYEALYSKSDFNIILCNGVPYSWGSNLFSRLGVISQEPKVRIPKQIVLPTKLKKIGIGNYHVFGIAINGQAYAWGKGNLGQLGIDRFENESKPTKVACTQPIADACCGDAHTLVLLQDGRLKSCGSNKYGVLGHAHFDVNDKKKKCKSLQYIQKDFDGQIQQITCGKYHNLIVNDKGVIYGWGNNQNHQILPIFDSPAIEKQPKSSKLLKRSLQIKVGDSQSSNRFENSFKENFEEASKMSQDQRGQDEANWQLMDWYRRFKEFKLQKQKQQQHFMNQLQQIIKQKKTKFST